MSLFAVVAALAVAIILDGALLVILVSQERRHRKKTQALHELYRGRLNGSAAIIENLRRRPALELPLAEAQRVVIRAWAHLLWTAREADDSGKPDVGATRRSVGAALDSLLPGDHSGEVQAVVRTLTGETAHV